MSSFFYLSVIDTECLNSQFKKFKLHTKKLLTDNENMCLKTTGMKAKCLNYVIILFEIIKQVFVCHRTIILLILHRSE